MSPGDLLTEIASFKRYSDADRPPGTPRLNLFINSETTSHAHDTYYRVEFTINRAKDDPERRPFIIHWDPIEDGFSQSALILRCRSAFQPEKGFEVLDIDTSELPTKSLHPREVSTKDPFFKQFEPGTSASWSVDLPSVYFDARRSMNGYHLIWVGGQIPLWDWGTLAEYSESRRRLAPKSPAIVLPNGAFQSFTVIDDESDLEDDVGEWGSSPRPMSPSARVPDSPVLSMQIAGPETLSVKDRSLQGRLHYPVTVMISYDAAPGPDNDKKPIVFHASIFNIMDSHYHGFRLYVKDNDEWRGHNVNGELLHHVYSSPPELVCVGQNKRNEFQTLMPGESWSFTRTVSDFPKNFAPGDRFRYGFNGAPLSWWDWGNFHDHNDTLVAAGEINVARPIDNDGRPELVVPASNWVEFTLVE
ncbi:hypothetical protein N7532_005338 [Penicillium argentinense]|uniref:Uncharacterized protein n=1 Tax=Penicillium argentinense TaxID=1131581 RepID=A0A9W9FDS9_9EURO|nr:uncharacterized protein N7532_005338 [Penicillium argentinense]KAJ5098337.1 hypothetical protein N7532_005338 [Penicillium argentinense]